MAVVIRLMRAGAKKRPFYRMVAADSRRQRDGRFLEILGHYNPIARPFELVVHKDKVQSWIAKGAQPSEQVASLLRSLDIPVRPVREPRTTAATATPTKKAARRKPRPPSARKVKARAFRAAKKKAPAKA